MEGSGSARKHVLSPVEAQSPGSAGSLMMACGVPETSEQGRCPGRAQSLINADLMHSLPRWGLALYPSRGIIPYWWTLETGGQSLCCSRNTETCKGRGPRPGVELSVLAPTSLPGPPRIPLL